MYVPQSHQRTCGNHGKCCFQGGDLRVFILSRNGIHLLRRQTGLFGGSLHLFDGDEVGILLRCSCQLAADVGERWILEYPGLEVGYKGRDED